MTSGYSFHPRAWAAVLAAAGCAAGIALGQWQAGRAVQKRALGEQFTRALQGPALELPPGRVRPDDYVMKRVAARGRFLPQHTVYLDNKLRHGRLGYEVVTPLQLGPLAVLVDRGWLAAGAMRSVPPEVTTPTQEVRIEGLALARLPHALQAAPDRGQRVRLNVDIDEFAQETSLSLQPIVIEQLSPLPDGLSRDWPRPDLGIERHESYSLQWYSLAALAVVLFVVLSFRRERAR
ncbi:MAG TPA: SURF1 family protein [Steroidobacteraceae bacterium]|nr:SURF1 family protein [Steroidobacteraceae bacterium]